MRVKFCGTPTVPVWVALKPKLTVPPVGIAAFQAVLVAVTSAPEELNSAFQPWLSRSPAGKVYCRAQPSRGPPRLVTVTLPVKPVFHWLTV